MVNKRGIIELDDIEIRKLLKTERVLQVASINKNGTPHLVPMWFVVEQDGSLVFTTYGRSPVSYTHLTLPTSDLV